MITKSENVYGFLHYPLQVNTLNGEVMDEVVHLLKDIETNSAVKSVVFMSGKPGNFIAGADVTMLQKVKNEQEAYEISKSCHKILDTIAGSRKPVVAAIQGTCLGGGLEVKTPTILACSCFQSSKNANFSFLRLFVDVLKNVAFGSSLNFFLYSIIVRSRLPLPYRCQRLQDQVRTTRGDAWFVTRRRGYSKIKKTHCTAKCSGHDADRKANKRRQGKEIWNRRYVG